MSKKKIKNDFGDILCEKYKTFIDYKCGECKSILLRLHDNIKIKLNYPIACCGKIRLI
jgi:hypothetical protein